MVEKQVVYKQLIYALILFEDFRIDARTTCHNLEKVFGADGGSFNHTSGTMHMRASAYNLQRAINNQLVVSNWEEFIQCLIRIFEEVKPNSGGIPAAYIPVKFLYRELVLIGYRSWVQ